MLRHEVFFITEDNTQRSDCPVKGAGLQVVQCKL